MRRTRVRLALLGAALVCALMVTGVAVASNFTAPVLKSPGKNAYVKPGNITLKVYSPGLSGASDEVYVAINPHRSLDKHGYLKGTCSVAKGCEFYGLKHWKGHRGWWIISSGSGFPGFWANTRGTYYWQANHVADPSRCDNANECEVASRIQKFHVR